MCCIWYSYLVEKENEVDGKTHKQSQETQVVEVTSQIVLKRKRLINNKIN